MNNLTKSVVKSVGRHFVTLSCVLVRPGNSREELFVFSGFLVDVEGFWFYVTAGHILRDIRALLASGAAFDVWRLDDQTAGNRYKGMAVPYSFNIEKWLVIEDESVGLDYAAVPLETMYVLALQAGGAMPIAKNAWGDQLTDSDRWALFGIPRESVTYDDVTIIKARVVLAPLEPTGEPATAGTKAQNQFYAKLDAGFEAFVQDLDGMSGGPIFAIKKVDDTWMYKVIGVQSGWYPDTKTISACPFSSFGAVLEDVIAKARLSFE